jgi:hypothetical protein
VEQEGGASKANLTTGNSDFSLTVKIKLGEEAD